MGIKKKGKEREVKKQIIKIRKNERKKRRNKDGKRYNDK